MTIYPSLQCLPCNYYKHYSHFLTSIFAVVCNKFVSFLPAKYLKFANNVIHSWKCFMKKSSLLLTTNKKNWSNPILYSFCKPQLYNMISRYSNRYWNYHQACFTKLEKKEKCFRLFNLWLRLFSINSILIRWYNQNLKYSKHSD